MMTRAIYKKLNKAHDQRELERIYKSKFYNYQRKNMLKILTAQIREEIYHSVVSRGLFLEE